LVSAWKRESNLGWVGEKPKRVRKDPRSKEEVGDNKGVHRMFCDRVRKREGSWMRPCDKKLEERKSKGRSLSSGLPKGRCPCSSKS
jgi:hypothetical protein